MYLIGDKETQRWRHHKTCPMYHCKLFEMSMLPYVQQCHKTIYFWHASSFYLWHPHTRTYTHRSMYTHTQSSSDGLTFHCAQSHSQPLHAYWMTSVYIWSPTTELCGALPKGMSFLFFFFPFLMSYVWGGKRWECFDFKHWFFGGFLLWKHIAFLLEKNIMFCHRNKMFLAFFYWDFLSSSYSKTNYFWVVTRSSLYKFSQDSHSIKKHFYKLKKCYLKHCTIMRKRSYNKKKR